MSGPPKRARLSARRIRKKKASVGFVMMNLQTGKMITYDPMKTFFGASTVKGPYTIAVCRSDKKAWKKHGDWMRSTVIDSDNSCYLLLRRQYGNDPIVSLYKKSKVSSKNAYKIWPYPSARDLARLWCGSYSFLRKNKAMPKRLRGMFSKVRHLPINTVIKRKTYSKPGWMDRQGINIYNDAGIVMSARGPYVIAVMTSLNGNDHGPVRELIRTLNKIQDTM